jgi:hypothetical protein
VYFHDIVDMWSCGVARIDYLRNHHGCVGVQKYYGNVETPMYAILKEAGMRYGYMIDFLEDSFMEMQNPLYQQWKHEHLAGFGGSFKEWLVYKNLYLEGDLT